MVHRIVPTVIGLIIKTIIVIVVFFILLNLFCMVSTYLNMSSLAEMVQTSVEKHGYLPYNDYIAIQRLVDAYDRSAGTDEELDPDQVSIPGLNKIVSNLRIKVYDGGDSTGTVHGLADEDTSDGRLYYIDTTGGNNPAKAHRKQQGSVLYSGVSFTYRILHPLMFMGDNGGTTRSTLGVHDAFVENAFDADFDDQTWWTNPVTQENARANLSKSTEDGGTYTTIDTEHIVFSEGSDPIASAGSGFASMFIQPRITTTFYADLDQENAYAR